MWQIQNEIYTKQWVFFIQEKINAVYIPCRITKNYTDIFRTIPHKYLILNKKNFLYSFLRQCVKETVMYVILKMNIFWILKRYFLTFSFSFFFNDA